MAGTVYSPPSAIEIVSEPDCVYPAINDDDPMSGYYYVVILRDSEVERIAQRVVELLRSQPAGVN